MLTCYSDLKSIISQYPRQIILNEMNSSFSAGILNAEENLIFIMFLLTVTIVPNHDTPLLTAPINAFSRIELSLVNLI